MRATPTPEAVEFYRQAILAFSRMSRNGIRINVPLLKKSLIDVKKLTEELEDKLRQEPEYKWLVKKFGSKANVSSRDQLRQYFFDELQMKPKTFTAKGQAKLDKDFLESQCSGFQYVQLFLLREKYLKAHSTYLTGLLREVDSEGFLHPFFHLHIASSLRTSSSMPNFQNMPIRDPVIGPLIRQLIVPRKGCVLGEIDYGAMEFRGAANFWGDPAMIQYASDPTKDIHRDLAMLCYKLKKEEVSKDARYCAKNKFVFPILYGSYYVSCAKNLWLHMNTMDLRLANDKNKTVREHLKEQGITKLGACDPKLSPKIGTFEYLIKQVEESFNKKFHVFCEKKERWWNDYVKNGFFRTTTGFVINGIHSRLFLMNAPIQGPSSHCLDWSVVEMQKELTRKKMKSLQVAQIHDCILGDVRESELQDYLNMSKSIMTERIRDEWKWIKTTLEIEVDVVENHESWNMKKPWIFDGSQWKPK